MSEVSIVEVATQTVLGIRRRGKYREISDMIPRIFHVAQEKGAKIAGRPVFVCHEQSAEEAARADEHGTADVEVAVPVSGAVEGTDDVRLYELPGGKMAKIVHRGPYGAVGPAYNTLFAWLEQNGKEVTGPTREVYVSDPRETRPEELITEIYAPVG